MPRRECAAEGQEAQGIIGGAKDYEVCAARKARREVVVESCMTQRLR
jgi:hypothetical protein